MTGQAAGASSPPDGPRQVLRIGGLLATGWAALAAVLVVSGEAVDRSAPVAAVDRRITAAVVAHRTPGLDTAMTALTWTGSWLADLALAVVLALLVWRRRLPAVVLAALLAGWVGELLAVTVTKSLVQRPRPPEAVRLVPARGWSFPSGHTANAVVVFGAAAALAALFTSPAGLRILAAVLAAVLALLVAFSRVELGVHWTSDVVASLLWTTAWLAAVVGFLLRPLRRAGPPPAGRRPATDAHPVPGGGR